MATLIKFFSFFQVILRLWPYVIDAVKLVENIKRTESGAVKKQLAKQFVREKVPNLMSSLGMSEEDWDNLLGGLIDVAVALLNWRGLW